MSRRAVLIGLLFTTVAMVFVAAPDASARTGPTVTSVSPGSGTIGTRVTIVGTGFTPTSTVSFGGVAAPRPSLTGTTRLVTTVPVDAASGPVTVTSGGSTTSSPAAFTVTAGLSSSAPSVVPGGSFVLHGVGFGASEAIDVLVDGAASSLTVSGPGGAADPTVTVPASAAVGTHLWTLVGRRSGIAAQVAVGVHTDWPQLYGGPAHQGRNGTENLLDATRLARLDEVWRHGPVANSPVTVAGGVVFSTVGGTVVATSLATGAHLWNSLFPHDVTSGTTVAGIRLVAADSSGVVSAVRTSNGTKLWTAVLGDTVSRPGTASGGLYVVPTDGGKLIALDLVTGAVVWSATLDGFAVTVPAISDGRVFVDSHGQTMYAFDLATGNLLWSQHEWMSSSTISVGSGVVVFGTVGDIVALRVSTGAVLWSVDPDGTPVGGMALVGGTVVVAEGATVEALSLLTGASVWQASPGGALLGVAAADGLAYVQGTATVWALATGTGNPVWSRAVSTGFGGVVIADGTITFVDQSDGSLVHLDVPGPDSG